MWGLKHPDLGVKHSDLFTEDDEYDILSHFFNREERTKNIENANPKL